MLERCCCGVFFFFFNDTATTEIYTLSLHDALPISGGASERLQRHTAGRACGKSEARSEEHTSELQSRGLISYAVFCLKKKKPCNGTSSCRFTTHAQFASPPSRLS